MLPLPRLLSENRETNRAVLAHTAKERISPGFYARRGKRILDVVSSAAGLLVLSPLFFLIGLLIKATSRGSVLYKQERVGKDGRPFQIIKFRSMSAEGSKMPAGITVSGDRRVTRVGKVLRRYKIDELPQLWNVLVGEMSLVGPRPELPRYVELYSRRQKEVLRVRPGITDLASLAYRNEEQILSRCEEPEKLYREEILPEKLVLNLKYLQNITFKVDLRIIFATIGCSFLFVESQPGRQEQ
jgi:lipopolysaccharide/colanic/teichoic acid biosynthesis glycosyltransferase